MEFFWLCPGWHTGQWLVWGQKAKLQKDSIPEELTLAPHFSMLVGALDGAQLQEFPWTDYEP